MTQARPIETPEDIAEATAHLARACPRMAHAITTCEEIPLRRRPEGFAQLLSAIVSQQVSVASARAIWARLEAAGLVDAPAILRESEESLRAHGLSRQKASYAVALAQAGIDFDALRMASDAQIIETLTAVKGIGQWTAEIYAMFSLGRPDVFPAADLALQESARLLYGLDDRPRPKALRDMAEDWAPWRAVAARVLWAYYHVAKDREGIV